MLFPYALFLRSRCSSAYFLLAFLPALLGTLNSYESFCQPQNPGYSIVNYNTENGLPQNSVNAIQFDKLGYCWLATEMGLVRFDGKLFREFGRILPTKTAPFRIENIGPDENGILHVSLPYSKKRQGLLIEDRKKLSASFPVLIDHSSTYVPVVGYAGNHDVINRMDSLFFHRTKSRHLSDALTTRAGHTYLVYQGQLYFLKDRNITLLADHQDRFKNINNATLVDDYFIHIGPGNRVTTWRNGTFQVAFNSIQGDISHEAGYLNGKFKTFWCVKGTYIYSGKSLYRIYVKDDVLMSEKVLGGLEIPNMKCIYFFEEQGKYYIGSTTEGLFVIEPSPFVYAPVPKEAPNQIFYPQSVTKEGKIFSKDILFESKTSSKYIPLKSKHGMATYITTENQLYYESDYTLSRYDLNTGRNVQMLKLDTRLRAIIPSEKNLIFFTRESVGTISKDSAIFQKRFKHGMKIIAATRLNQDHFLLSTEFGLKWYHFKQHKVFRSVLDSVQIRTAVPDTAGRIWIASYGMGFYLYENGKIVRMPYGPKQALKTVHAFIDDGKGYFWLPTNNGLFKVQKEALLDFAHKKTDNVYYYMFDKKNGLRTNEFNGGCDPPYVRLKDGMLSLSSINGLVWFYPDKIKTLYPQNDIYIDDVFVNGKQVRLDNYVISLDPDFEDLSVTVSSPYFGNSVNEYIQYHIVGLNSWQPLPANGKIVVGRSPAGSYKIVVRNATSPKTNTPQIIEVAFEVKPWFYNTWWFYSILLLLVIAIAYLGARTRIKNLKAKAKQLEQLVEARTLELKASVEELTHSQGDLLKSTRVKDSVISMVLHDLRSPISFLNAISHYLAKSHTSLDAGALSQKLNELESGTEALNDFTRKFFDWAKSQHEDFKVKKTTFQIQDLLHEVVPLYSEILKISNNQLVVAPSDLVVYTDYQILAVVLRNLIDNANKNTKNGVITLSVRSSDADVIFSVSDTGTGLTADEVGVFLDKSKGMGQKGIGSILILTMLDKIDGKLDIVSSLKNGSTFSVILSGQS